MGRGLRPFGNNSLRSSLQKMLDPVMCGSSRVYIVDAYEGLYQMLCWNPLWSCQFVRGAFSFQNIVLPILRSALLAIIGHAGPRWTIRLSIHLVLGLPCRLVHSRGVHAITLLIYLLVHLLSLNRTMCPAHPCTPFLITSMMSFTPAWCRIQELRVWSHNLTTNLAACVCVFVCAQNFTNFSPHALISSPNVPKILFA